MTSPPDQCRPLLRAAHRQPHRPPTVHDRHAHQRSLLRGHRHQPHGGCVHLPAPCRSRPVPGRSPTTTDPPDQRLRYAACRFHNSRHACAPRIAPSFTRYRSPCPAELFLRTTADALSSKPIRNTGTAATSTCLFPAGTPHFDLLPANHRNIVNQLRCIPEAVARRNVKIHPPGDRASERRARHPQDRPRTTPNPRRTRLTTLTKLSSRKLGQ